MSHYDDIRDKQEQEEREQRIKAEWEAFVDSCSESGSRPPESTQRRFDIAVNGKVLGKKDNAVESAVDSPKHYQFFKGIEAIEIIARSMTLEQFHGYCLGNKLKYKLRAGLKTGYGDNLVQDTMKANKYDELFDKYKGECVDA